MSISCYHCGTPLGHIDDPCPNCLPQFGAAYPYRRPKTTQEKDATISRLTADNEALRNERDEARTALHEYLMIDKTVEKQLVDQAALIEQVQGISEGRARDALHLRNTLAVHQCAAKKWERLCVALEADKAKLRAQAEDARAAHHRTSHKAVKRLRALWREKQAAEARADALAQEVERLRLPEGTLAKHGSTITIEFDNAEYALRAFDAIEYAMSREPAALANEEAGR